MYIHCTDDIYKYKIIYAFFLVRRGFLILKFTSKILRIAQA